MACMFNFATGLVSLDLNNCVSTKSFDTAGNSLHVGASVKIDICWESALGSYRIIELLEDLCP